MAMPNRYSKSGLRKPRLQTGQNPAAIKTVFGSATIVAVFNIAGNKYRLMIRGELSIPRNVRTVYWDTCTYDRISFNASR